MRMLTCMCTCTCMRMGMCIVLVRASGLAWARTCAEPCDASTAAVAPSSTALSRAAPLVSTAMMHACRSSPGRYRQIKIWHPLALALALALAPSLALCLSLLQSLRPSLLP